MASQHIDLQQCTLDLLILRTLLLEPQHRWGISEGVEQMSGDAPRIQQASSYPALRRLERWSWIKAAWGPFENNRRAKYYEPTRSVSKQLEVKAESSRKLTVAVAQILENV